MESGGGSSTSRRSGGGRGDGDRSSSSTQGFFAEKGMRERDGAAPKCHCGVYAVLYLSKTTRNPNRLFFGCPNFKVSLRHCKFFLWMDQHVAKFGGVTGANQVKGEEDEVDKHFGILKIDDRLAELEDRMAAIEKKGAINMWLGCVCLVVVLLSLYLRR